MLVTFVCTSGVWQGTGAPDGPVACPASAPTSGSSCAACAGRWPSECDYGPLCFGNLTTTAICDSATGTWSLSESSCNPPGFYDGGGAPDAGVDGPSE
jgi:hypothetical protein